jgi:hypothetical protein
MWSAVAASFAALSSGLTVLIHWRTMIEAARPELVLLGWSRVREGADDSALEVIGVRTVRNIGRGAAFHVVVRNFEERDNKLISVMETVSLPALAPGEAAEINAEGEIWWENIAALPGVKILALDVETLCWDRTNRRHKTTHRMYVFNPPDQATDQCVAPGIAFGSRTTVARPVRLLKIQMKVRRTPGLRRFWRESSHHL